MEVFRGLQVQTGIGKDGVKRMIDVPVFYGSVDRVAASILANNTQNQPLRLPKISVFMSGIVLAPDRYKGIDAVSTNTYVPRGGVFPDDIRTIHTLQAVPYKLQMDAYLFTSNTDTQLQLLEQLLVLFNPIMQIQTSDAVLDPGKITTIELTGINLEENFPISTDKRYIQTTLTFEVVIYVGIPSQIKNDIIKQIQLRMGTINDNNVFEQFGDGQNVIDAAEIFTPTQL
jgi:hypothetical protein